MGTLTPGVAADLIVLDPGRQWTVDPAAFASKGKNTPLGGHDLTGAVRTVILGGAIACNLEDVVV